MQYKQMEKADRDSTHALRAEDECRQLLVQFPNSKFAPEAQQMLRNVQEVLADKEYRVGMFYRHKGSFPAAANRLQALTDQFPLYSQADEALWDLATPTSSMGDRFENQQAAAYTQDRPRLSAELARGRSQGAPGRDEAPGSGSRSGGLCAHEVRARKPHKPQPAGKVWGPSAASRIRSVAAKSGSPQMTGFRPRFRSAFRRRRAGVTGVTDVRQSRCRRIRRRSIRIRMRGRIRRARPPPAQRRRTKRRGAGGIRHGREAAPAQRSRPPQNHTMKPKKVQEAARSRRTGRSRRSSLLRTRSSPPPNNEPHSAGRRQPARPADG